MFSKEPPTQGICGEKCVVKPLDRGITATFWVHWIFRSVPPRGIASTANTVSENSWSGVVDKCGLKTLHNDTISVN